MAKKQNVWVKVAVAGAAVGAIAYAATRVKRSVFGEENLAKQLNINNKTLRVTIVKGGSLFADSRISGGLDTKIELSQLMEFIRRGEIQFVIVQVFSDTPSSDQFAKIIDGIKSVGVIPTIKMINRFIVSGKNEGEITSFINKIAFVEKDGQKTFIVILCGEKIVILINENNIPVPYFSDIDTLLTAARSGKFQRVHIFINEDTFEAFAEEIKNSLVTKSNNQIVAATIERSRGNPNCNAI